MGENLSEWLFVTSTTDRRLKLMGCDRTWMSYPNAVCLTPDYVEGTLKGAGFKVEGTEVMLAGITMLTKALKPPQRR